MLDCRTIICSSSVRVTQEELAACAVFRDAARTIRGQMAERSSAVIQKLESGAAVERGPMTAELVASAGPGPASKVLLINGHPVTET